MRRGFLNSPSQGKKAPRAAPQPANSTATSNGSRTKPTPVAPVSRTAAVGETAKDSDTSSVLFDVMKKKLKAYPGVPADTLILQVEETDSAILSKPLPSDAPGLYPGKTVIHPHGLSKSRSPSSYLEEKCPAIHMFTLPLGGEPETAVCLYPGSAGYLKRHKGFELPLGIPRGVKPSWEIKEVVGLGKGLFATKDISPGDIIVAERPLVVHCSLPNNPNHPAFKELGTKKIVADGMSVIKSAHDITADTYRMFPQTVNRLGPERRKAFFGLLDAKSEVDSGGYITKAEGIVRTNCIGLSLPGIIEGTQTSAVCENISRANHSCIPNAHYYFNYVNFSYELRALNPIPTNTEITVAYIVPFVPRATRQSTLSLEYEFTCSCIGCTDPTANQRLIDFGEVLAKENELQDQLYREVERGPQGRPGALAAFSALRSLYLQHTYLFSSDPIPDHAGYQRLEMIEKWVHLEMVFGQGSEAAVKEVMKVVLEGMKVIEKMEPCPSSKGYRVLDAYIKGGKEGKKVAEKICEWM